jgi:ABC-type Fe3+/spermidine/putrescine transport system ATPase subunit
MRETLIEDLEQVLRETRITTILSPTTAWRRFGLATRLGVMNAGEILQIPLIAYAPNHSSASFSLAEGVKVSASFHAMDIHVIKQ